MALQGTMEGICVIYRRFLDNIHRQDGQTNKKHKFCGPISPHKRRFEEEKCRDIKGNFHICRSCLGNQSSRQGEVEAEVRPDA